MSPTQLIEKLAEAGYDGCIELKDGVVGVPKDKCNSLFTLSDEVAKYVSHFSVGIAETEAGEHQGFYPISLGVSCDDPI